MFEALTGSSKTETTQRVKKKMFVTLGHVIKRYSVTSGLLVTQSITILGNSKLFQF